ncbi:MAG: type 1 glutamine amidotransferase domain-containing protein [Burkholderiales bacterium]|nr:type 1 glutamine amidotransferase domain-containing protein [Burkholderiales bacterium]
MPTVLVPTPSRDFDPTEAAVPWQTLRALGISVLFATPDGRPGVADPRILSGQGLGPLARVLMADANGRKAYAEMAASPEFLRPISWSEARISDVQGLLLPGGHAPGMKPYLESTDLQSLVAAAFAARLPVGAICHGVVLAARSRAADGRSVLYGRKTTALTKPMELTAWYLTCAWLGSYYRTYPTTVEDEVTAALGASGEFMRGPMSATRDAPDHLERGFTVRDEHYLSARWPGDAHRFAVEFGGML